MYGLHTVIVNKFKQVRARAGAGGPMWVGEEVQRKEGERGHQVKKFEQVWVVLTSESQVNRMTDRHD